MRFPITVFQDEDGVHISERPVIPAGMTIEEFFGCTAIYDSCLIHELAKRPTIQAISISCLL